MRFHALRHILRVGLKSILVHRLRSTLTIMGIVLGVASVIVMLAVGEAARFEAIQQIKDLGATNIIVRSVKPIDDDKQASRQEQTQYGLLYRDVERIEATIPTILTVTPLREFRRDLRFLDRKLEGRVVSVYPNYAKMNSLQMGLGRFITDSDNERFANVCVLGAETAETLFPIEDPIGRSVCVADAHYYRVVGVTERKASSAGIGGSQAAQDYNRDIYIPFQTGRVRFGEMLMYHRGGTFEFEKLQISQITVAVDDISHVKKTAEIIKDVLAQFHKKKDTEITVPLDLLEKAEQTQRIFTLVLGAIASVSLVVGGIGVMNIMLATVTERTREIGVRRALGAKRRDIALQFLIETIVLSGTGGVLGVLLGFALSYSVNHFFHFPTIIPAWSPLLALGVSLGVGLIFGIYPAQRAARMDPIEALRHE
jgi:putative ABC transport system permease protein